MPPSGANGVVSNGTPPHRLPPNDARPDPADPRRPLSGPIPQVPPAGRTPGPNGARPTPPPRRQSPPSAPIRQTPGAGPRQIPPGASPRPEPPNPPDGSRYPRPQNPPRRQSPPSAPLRQTPPNAPRQPLPPNAPPSEPFRQVPPTDHRGPRPPQDGAPPGRPRPPQRGPRPPVEPPNQDPRYRDPQYRESQNREIPRRDAQRPDPRRSYPPGPPSGPVDQVPRAPRAERAMPRHIPPAEAEPRRRPAGERPSGPRPDSARPARARGDSAGPRTAQQAVVEQEPEDSSTSRLVRDSGSIAVATLVSRITGFVKQLLLVTVLGPAIASAFTVSSTIPTMISELLLGAVLTAIVVPTLVRAEKEDADRGAAFVRRLVTAAFTVLAIGTVLAVAAAPVMTTHIFLSHDGKVNTALTTALAFLLLPAILFYGMSGLLMAILNTHQVFKPGAWAPVLNNVVVLAILTLYAVTPGEISLDPVRMSDPKLLVLGVGVTVGVIVQMVSLLPAIRRLGIDLRPLWGVDARLKQFAGMGAAIILYVFISQIGWTIATRVSSHADVAGPTIYQNAWLLLQLPYGVLGVTLLTAIMPRLSRNAAADDNPAVVDDLGVATRLTMISLVPVVTFLTIAGPQIGQALYGYGHFGSSDAGRLGEAVSWSAFTLIPYALVLIHLRVFYAREQAWTPTWIILGITGVKIVLSLLTPVFFSDDHVVIALGVANGLGFVTGAVIGGWLLHRSLGDLRMANVGRTVTRVVLASVAGAAVTLIIDQVLGLSRLDGGLASVLRVGLDAIVMFGVAFGLMRLAGVPEIVALTVAVSRRLGFTPPAPDLGLDDTAVDMHDTMVLPRPDLAAPYYYRYDPYTDAQTMVLPVIRPGAVDRTGQDEFPYPVRQRNANAGATPAQRTSRYQGEGGARVSDDAAEGQPSAEAADAAGAVRTDDVPPGSVPPADRTPESASDHTEASNAAAAPDGEAGVDADVPDAPNAADAVNGNGAEAVPPGAVPPRDPAYDTGMLPVGSPEMPPMRVEPPSRRVPRGPKLIPGASVAGGRYRLLADHGGARGLRFWQALDVKLDREVALTFVDADQKAGDNPGHDGPQAILSRTLRLGRINSSGLARVLDVVRGSSGGIVVAEWTPGRSLREMAETKPSPIGAARAIRALAAAAELAHRGGGSLSIDHPDRVRISASGDAVLAFPGTLADSDAQSDVRGLGAMLYALITARWPIRTGGVTGAAATVGGLKLADFGSDGSPVEPRQIRPEVPFEISAVAVRSLEADKGVRTAATVQHVLEQASVVDQKTDFIPVLRLGQRAVANPDETLADPELLAAERERSQRMLWILVGLGVLAALVVGVIIWWLLSIFAPGSADQPLNEQQRKLGLTTASVAPTAPAAQPAGPAPTTAAGLPLQATGVSVYSPEGTPDSPGNVSALLDGNPTTTWHTDQYFQQFPALKKGVGVLATLPGPSKVSKVVIDSASPGTVVEVRTSPTAVPTLDQTQLVGQATLADGTTTIPVQSDQPARYVLIWITQLANNGGQFQTSLGDIRFEAAS
ncbi:murein biosynthesis integral membrane protein MurJ [Nocardia cerradoensis]|nr:murein biosynthesis integral membrane protein MurJ [Nocardia cerradoensis]